MTMNATETGSLITTSYRVDVLGYIWWPNNVPCATTVHVSEPMEYTRAEDETDEEYLLRMVQCAAPTGDFSQVIAWQIVKEETWHEAPEGWTGAGERRPIGVSSTYTRKDRYTTLCEFTEEEAETWDRAMFSEWDEDEED